MFCRFHSFTARYHSHCPAGCRQRFEELRTLGPQDLIHRIHRIVSSLNVMLPERNVHGLRGLVNIQKAIEHGYL